MNRDKKIDYIEFKANDISAIKAFYTSVFDWQFTDYGPDYTSFSDGRISGGFDKGEVITGAGPLIVIFVDDLPATLDSVRSHGGTITKEIFSFPGGSRFQFTDPSGNELAAWLETSE
jgi:uncharacterized protein